MKKIFLCLIGFIIATNMYSQDFYYYKNEKLKLELNTQYLNVLCNINSKEKLNEQLKAIGEITKFSQDIYYKRLIPTFRNSPEWMTNGQNYVAEIKLHNTHLSKEELQRMATVLKTNHSMLNVSFHYTFNHTENLALTNYVWVQIKDESQISKLIEEANKIHYSVLGQNPFMKDWVMLGANKNAILSPMLVSQQLYESKIFKNAEPDMLNNVKSTCINDPLFNTQWGLRNTNTPGLDIGACEAWGYANGTGIKIAIIDEGFENSHPDLNGNLENSGYNCITGTSPTAVYGPHGTACAGIAAAVANNNLGVGGVAYGSKIMSVSMLFANSAGTVGNTTPTQKSDAFLWAMSHGADVISNSWGGGTPSSIIDDAITIVTTFGRNNNGCVVVFSTGNDSLSTIGYPSSSNPNIITVGNLMSNGYRNFSSNYGSGLDIIAPGTGISTTDQQGNVGYNSSAGVNGNYTTNFNGTSAACPIVAGVAALILSANPCLTQAQVSSIINKTAKKIFGYLYTTSATHPDGTWNSETGYGLIDAEAAVIMAQASYLQNITNAGTTTYAPFSPIIVAGYNVNPNATYGNYVTTSTANVTIQAAKAIEFKPGCDLQGTVNVQSGTYLWPCTSW